MELKKTNLFLDYLDDSGASDNVVVSGLLVALGENNVALTSNTLGDSDHELAITSRLDGSPDRSSDGDECGINVASIGGVHALASHQVNLRSSHSSAHRRHGQGGESLDGKLSIALRARNNEGSSKGVDLVEVEGVVEGLGRGGLAKGSTQVGTVTSFNSEDASSSSEISLVHDAGRGTEVCANSDT